MKKIPLTQGQFALVDDEDYERLLCLKWSISHSTCNSVPYRYAHSWIKVSRYGKSDGKHMRMHRFILGVTDRNVFIDHKDHDGLNNQKSNLRICNRSLNRANYAICRKNKTGFIGVYQVFKRGKYRNRWMATIRVDGKIKYLGRADTPKEAAVIRDIAAIKYFGDFAQLNFPIK